MLQYTGADEGYLSLGNDDDFGGPLEKRNYFEAGIFVGNYGLQISNCPLFWNTSNVPYL